MVKIRYELSMFMSFRVYRLLLCVFLVSCSHSNTIGEQELVPASFADTLNDMSSQIEFPEVEFEGEIIIRCAVRVSRTGNASSLYIYASPVEREIFTQFESTVFEALDDNIEFVPAIYKGRNVGVWFSFSVMFARNGDSESVSIHPNYLYNSEAYGPFYSGPQRVMRTSFFPSACRRSQARIWVAAEIDSRGHPSNVRVVAGNGNNVCMEDLIEGLQESEFIPARNQGQFVDATYAEAWFTNPRGRTELRPFSRVRR